MSVFRTNAREAERCEICGGPASGECEGCARLLCDDHVEPRSPAGCIECQVDRFVAESNSGTRGHLGGYVMGGAFMVGAALIGRFSAWRYASWVAVGGSLLLMAALLLHEERRRRQRRHQRRQRRMQLLAPASLDNVEDECRSSS